MTRLDRRSVTFLTFERRTAEALERRLEELFAHLLGPDQATWPVVGRLQTLEEATVRIRVAGAPTSVESATASEPLVYVQPEMMIVAEALGRFRPDGPGQEAWLGMRLLDHALRRGPVIRMEAVYAGGAALWSSLAEAVGLGLPAGADPSWPRSEPDVRGYAAAVAGLLAAPPSVIDPASPEKLRLTGRFPVCAGGEGLAFLGRGWSSPEEGWTWSEGPAASLVFATTSSSHRICRLTGWLINHPDRPVRLEVFLDRTPVALLQAAPGEGLEVRVEVALPPSPAANAHVVDLLIRDPVSPADASGGHDRRPLGVALSEVALLDEAESGAETSPACLGDPLVERLLARWTPRLTLVVAADPALAAAFGEGLRRLGCPQILLAAPAPPASTATPPALPVAAGVHVAGEGLADLARRLQDVGARADLAVLCDAEAVSSWFEALGDDTSSAALARASLIVNSGDPYVCGLEFNAYAARWGALIQTSDTVTVADTWAIP